MEEERSRPDNKARIAVGFPLWSGGFCKEPKHPRRMEWHRNEPGGGSPASIRPKRFSV
jgi:hypothetical protein